jgi:hypothetical protein
MVTGKQASNQIAKPATESQLEKLIAKQKKIKTLLAAANVKCMFCNAPKYFLIIFRP